MQSANPKINPNADLAVQGDLVNSVNSLVISVVEVHISM